MEASLAVVRQLASAPYRFRDPSAIMAALQKLADDARTTGHGQAAEYEAILRQCRPYLYNTQLGDIIIRLLGSKEESRVANTIAKMTKNQPATGYFAPYPRPYRGRGRAAVRGRRGPVCFNCGQPGHFQRHCQNVNQNQNRPGPANR